MPKSKSFRVAVEGATATDGRTISAQEINEMAAGYNRETYGARINLEHLRGYDPASPFKSYGDVLGLEAKDTDLTIDGKAQKRRALYATIDPTPALVAMNKDRQKVYTSVEIAPNFANTGKAGLVGLAVTDSPASLGTDVLSFSAKADEPAAVAIKADLDRRKLNPANFFSSALETTFEVEGEAEPSFKEQLVAVFAELGIGKKKEQAVEPAKAADPAPLTPEAFSTALERVAGALGDRLDRGLQGFRTELAGLRTDHDALKAGMDGTAQHTTRPPSTGGASGVQTDC